MIYNILQSSRYCDHYGLHSLYSLNLNAQIFILQDFDNFLLFISTGFDT